MTTLAIVALSEAQQQVIEARLDTIDRMLVGRVPRADRAAIVREVESQIQELLAQRDTEAITREDVLDVLRRLDPPEAYLPDLPDDSQPAPLRGPVHRPALGPAIARPTAGSEGKLGGIFGLCSLGLLLFTPVVCVLAALLESQALLFVGLLGIALLGLASGITALVLSIRGRRQGVLPILGIIAGSVVLPVWLLGAAYAILLGVLS